MADAATMTIKAVLLPDEIQTTLKDLTFSYTPADANDKWFYGIINVPHNTGGVDLISGVLVSLSVVQYSLFAKHTSTFLFRILLQAMCGS